MANGLFNTQPFAESAVTSAYPGGGITLSASGCTSGTGIVWSTTSPNNTFTFIGSDVVRAFDAETLQELWNSNQNAARDGAGNFAKFMQPMVANGKVYVPTFSKELLVYGLLPKSHK
jgi:outer membrane protein assembly factor BamB